MKTTLILGSTVIDMIVRVPHLPVTQEDINTRSMTMALGGCAYNAARMLRLFRPAAVSLFAHRRRYFRPDNREAFKRGGTVAGDRGEGLG